MVDQLSPNLALSESSSVDQVPFWVDGMMASWEAAYPLIEESIPMAFPALGMVATAYAMALGIRLIPQQVRASQYFPRWIDEPDPHLAIVAQLKFMTLAFCACLLCMMCYLNMLDMHDMEDQRRAAHITPSFVALRTVLHSSSVMILEMIDLFSRPEVPAEIAPFVARVRSFLAFAAPYYFLLTALRAPLSGESSAYSPAAYVEALLACALLNLVVYCVDAGFVYPRLIAWLESLDIAPGTQATFRSNIMKSYIDQQARALNLTAVDLRSKQAQSAFKALSDRVAHSDPLACVITSGLPTMPVKLHGAPHVYDWEALMRWFKEQNAFQKHFSGGYFLQSTKALAPTTMKPTRWCDIKAAPDVVEAIQKRIDDHLQNHVKTLHGGCDTAAVSDSVTEDHNTGSSLKSSKRGTSPRFFDGKQASNSQTNHVAEDGNISPSAVVGAGSGYSV